MRRKLQSPSRTAWLALLEQLPGADKKPVSGRLVVGEAHIAPNSTLCHARHFPAGNHDAARGEARHTRDGPEEEWPPPC